MSISTDAYLFYGIRLTSDLSKVAKKMGLFEEGTDYDSLDSDEIIEVLDGVLKDEFPAVEIITTGHCSEPTYYVGSKNQAMAYRGYDRKIKDLPKPSKTAQRSLKALSLELGLQPAFWLAYYTDY